MENFTSKLDSPFKEEEKSFQLFIGCIPGTAKPEHFIQKYKKYGEIFDIKLKQGKNKKTASGHATFTTPSKQLYKFLISTPQTILGRRITCQPYLKGKDKLSHIKSLNNRRIFIKGLNPEWKDDQIFEFFHQIWEVEKAYAIRKSQHTNRGFGYVNFFRAEDAKEAIRLECLDFEGFLVKCKPFKKISNADKSYSSGHEAYNTAHHQRRRRKNRPNLLKKKKKKSKKPNLDFSERDERKITGIIRSKRIQYFVGKNHCPLNLRLNQVINRSRSMGN